MNSITKRTVAGFAAVASTIAFSSSVAFAQTTPQMFQANLAQLNGSGDSGTATVSVEGNQATVTVNASDTSPNLPHAQHMHIGGQNVCPPASAAGEDNLINTPEGKPFYGEIEVSLTTEGAVGKDSALAVDRFPVADDSGTISYSRTFDLPSGVTAADVANGVIVQHGISELFNDKTKYDGDKKSPLNKDLPLEATIPSSCGSLVATSAGGFDAGSGGVAGVENQEAIIAGAAMATLGFGLLVVRKLARAS